MRALVALGSNLGNRRSNLADGLEALTMLGVVSSSPLWPETPDVSGRGPDYMNNVALLETPETDPAALLEALLRAELRLGRDRSKGRNAPRTLDLDLIAVEGVEGRWCWPTPADLAVLGPELTLELPHPRAHLRPFVTGPVRALGLSFFPKGAVPAVTLADGLRSRVAEILSNPFDQGNHKDPDQHVI